MTKLHTIKYRGIAQQVEHRSPKPSAEGSIPSAPAKNTDIVFAMSVFFIVQTKRTRGTRRVPGEVAFSHSVRKSERNEAPQSAIAPCSKRALSRSLQEGCEALRFLLPKKRLVLTSRFFHHYRFITKFAIYLRCDILLRNAICPFKTRMKSIS